MGPAD